MMVKKIAASVVMVVALAAGPPTVGAHDNDGPHLPDALRALRIVGSWRVDVGQSATGLAPFRALHSFSADGTFVETTDLLAMLNDGPGHGVWNFRAGKHQLTFELFAFDPAKNPAGIVRVRCAIQLVTRDEISGDCGVDFIDPTGAEFNDIDSAPLKGTRIKVIPR